jgi:hypothetical protein
MPLMRDAASCQEDYRRFIERVASSGEAWILNAESGAAHCESNEEDSDVILFFSDAAYARRVQQKVMTDYEPSRLDLFDVLFRWLPGMAKDEVLAGPNWTGDLIGMELNPLQVQKDLYAALSPEQRTDYKVRLNRAKHDESSAP